MIGEVVTGDYFLVLGVPLFLGTNFSPNADGAAWEPSAIVSYDFFSRRLKRMPGTRGFGRAVARLQPGVNRAQAEAATQVAVQHLWPGAGRPGQAPPLVRLVDGSRGRLAAPHWIQRVWQPLESRGIRTPQSAVVPASDLPAPNPAPCDLIETMSDDD